MGTYLFLFLINIGIAIIGVNKANGLLFLFDEVTCSTMIFCVSGVPETVDVSVQL